MHVTNNTGRLREEYDGVQDVSTQHADGLTLECVCPKCGTAHRMKILWSGRGKPKKFCPPCKSVVSSLETIDFCAVSADVHRGIQKAI